MPLTWISIGGQGGRAPGTVEEVGLDGLVEARGSGEYQVRSRLPADEVDVVVINPRNEQTCSVPQHKRWPMFTAGASVDEHEAIARLRFINKAPVDFIAKLAALVPKPRVNLTRFHGVFAPNSKHRVSVTPARRGKVSRTVTADQEEKTPTQRHVATDDLGSETETSVQY